MRTLEVNGVELCVDARGEPSDAAILLIGGGAASMEWWDDEFCDRLVAGLRYVIRYDHRDTGQSTTYPVGAPGYSMLDLAADAVGVLDALGVEKAHVFGMSMGGSLALRVALDHPDRVRTLTLMSTSPGGPGLAPMSAGLEEYFAADEPPDWSDHDAVVDYLVAGERAFEAPEHFDEARTRERITRVVDRANSVAAGMTNHAILDPGEPPRPRLGELRVPTLVVHGTADPMFPFGHAEVMAREIPDAELLPMPGVGHQAPPPAVWPSVIPALLRHTSGGWEEQGDRLSSRSYTAGDPTGWFDRLYAAAAAGEVDLPWSRTTPHPLLAGWAETLAGQGRSAVVVGCGLGADAEFVASLGFDTVAFDVAETAVRVARERHPESTVDYVVADLLHLPDKWLRAFDLVVEVITVQALPDPPRRAAIVNVGRLVAPGGTLVVVAARADETGEFGAPPPWPLTRDEIDAFTTDGLRIVRVEELTDPRVPGSARWRAEFQR